MQLKKHKQYNKKLLALVIVSLVAILVYLLLFMDYSFLRYFLQLRIPKIATIILVAFAIGGASIVFQSLINNTIVTPCLLGMNSLYTLIHTGMAFFLGTSSYFVSNVYISFIIDLLLMGVIASLIYGYLFKKTKYNVLYILLIGTILTTFFTSMQTTMVRMMDPNEYDVLLSSLFASFQNINISLFVIAFVLLVLTTYLLRKDIALLDVITLGKQQAINLGVDYQRVVFRLLLGVTICISIATALVGPISFLGLIIANLARQLFKTYRYFYLILGSALIGVVVLIVGQIVVEHIYSYHIPISVFINVSGGLYFLYLLLKQRRA